MLNFVNPKPGLVLRVGDEVDVLVKRGRFGRIRLYKAKAKLTKIISVHVGEFELYDGRKEIKFFSEVESREGR
jgi:hypothetical protein